MTKWLLRNGKWISDSKLTEMRLNTADLYDGLVTSPIPIQLNHNLAKRIREMSNSEYSREFGIATTKKRA